MLLVPVGSRHEDDAHAGLSHFLEHLVFKGTRAHPDAGLLSQLVEGIGGSVNASTDRELTVYSAKVPAEHVGVALEAVSELALRPLLRRRDHTSEKPVIVDEIRMYVDSPSDHIFTLFDEMLYAGIRSAGRSRAPSVRCAERRTGRSSNTGGPRIACGEWCSPWPVRIDHDEVVRASAGWKQEGPADGPNDAGPTTLARDAPDPVPRGLAAGLVPAPEPGQPLPRDARGRSQ